MWTTPSGVQKPSPDTRIQDITRRPGNFRVMERIPLDPADVPITFREPKDGDTTIVALDCETTGLGSDDAIIELSMVRCRYGETGELAGVDESLDMFQDPGKPIPPDITRLTGITDDMVRGKRINGDTVRDILRDDPIIVAHNAAFDRPRFERMFPGDFRWACSMVGIPWVELGHDAYGLGTILQREGWFFDAHRATADCLAVAWLLSVVPGALHTILSPTIKVMAIDAPYHVKDILKRRGYWWDPAMRYWWILRKASDRDAELEYLENTYPGGSQARVRAFDMRAGFRG